MEGISGLSEGGRQAIVAPVGALREQPARQLRIATSQHYHGLLQPWVTLSHAGLLSPRSTNFTAWNISPDWPVAGFPAPAHQYIEKCFQCIDDTDTE